MAKSQIIFLGLALIMFTACNAQSSKETVNNNTSKARVGGAFENNDFYIKGLPENISAVDTSAGWKLEGTKIRLTGTILKRDGVTPAPDVVLYYYQTNPGGRYLHKEDEPRSMPPNQLGQTHGYIRGWVKSDKQGRYTIYTVRPGSYPGGREPAHIHATIIEPGINEYYIDDFLFEDDPFLTAARRAGLTNRSGNGIITLVEKDGVLTGIRNLTLGLNIPGYPERK